MKALLLLPSLALNPRGGKRFVLLTLHLRCDQRGSATSALWFRKVFPENALNNNLWPSSARVAPVVTADFLPTTRSFPPEDEAASRRQPGAAHCLLLAAATCSASSAPAARPGSPSGPSRRLTLRQSLGCTPSSPCPCPGETGGGGAGTHSQHGGVGVTLVITTLLVLVEPRSLLGVLPGGEKEWGRERETHRGCRRSLSGGQLQAERCNRDVRAFERHPPSSPFPATPCRGRRGRARRAEGIAVMTVRGLVRRLAG